MAEIKLVMSNKDGKSYQKVLSIEESKQFIGKRIGDKFKGEIIDLAGFEFELTGGSDYAGFPMRKDVNTARKKILAVSGKGLTKIDHGTKQRKTVAGNMIHEKTAQINARILKLGSKSLDELFPPKEKKE